MLDGVADFQSGDVLAFSGEGFVSNVIKFFTCSRYSHVGIVAWTSKSLLAEIQLLGHSNLNPILLANWSDKFLLYESTTLNDTACELQQVKMKGVQAHDPQARTESYQGSAWRMRLAPDYRLEQNDAAELTHFLVEHLGWKYNTEGALLAGTTLLNRAAWRSQGEKREFCDELVGVALQRIHRMNIGRASLYTPGSLIRWLLENGVYTEPEQIK